MGHDSFSGLPGRVFDLSFTDDWCVPARCRAALLLSPSGATEIAILELSENHGRSVTNSWPIVAERILAAYLLLEELEGRWNYLIEECALAAERDLTDREWVKDKNSEKLLQRAGDNVRALKT